MEVSDTRLLTETVPGIEKFVEGLLLNLASFSGRKKLNGLEQAEVEHSSKG